MAYTKRYATVLRDNGTYDSDIKKGLIESALDSISILRQCALFGYNRSTYYYKPSEAHSMTLHLYSTRLKIPF